MIDKFIESEDDLERKLDGEAVPLDKVTSDTYDALPASIKMLYTRGEYYWLGDAGQADVVRRECEPEC